jgi:hypothetical protein
MITATLLASIGIALAPQNVLSLESLKPEVQGALSVSLHLEETRFAARSLSGAPMLMIVADRFHGIENALWLPPGATYNELFPRGTLDSLQLELLSITDGVWTSTGALFLSDFMPNGNGQLWVLDCGHVLTQSEEDAVLTVASPAGALLPSELNAMTDEFPAHGESTGVQLGVDGIQLHVPVPTPTDKPKEDKPPVKRRRQLPPL